MNREKLVKLIETLIRTHSPCGNEKEIDGLLMAEFRKHCARVWQDPAGNVIGLIPGPKKAKRGPMAIGTHKDEIGMIVKRVEEDGRVTLESTGGSQAWIYGEGAIDILGDKGIVTGVLSFGARHVSAESHGAHPGRDGKTVAWVQAWVTTKLPKSELEKRGVHIGCKAVIGRDRKRVLVLGDYVCTYALDCKGSLAVMLNVMEGLRGRKLDRDVYFCAFSREETGALGGCYAARTLPCEHIIAIEVGPVAREYQTQNCEKPILLYQDAMGVYDEDGNTELAKAAESAGVDVQRAVLATFGSDASVSARYGQLARANCICFPTENTHGYEIASLSGIENTAKVLLAYLSG